MDRLSKPFFSGPQRLRAIGRGRPGCPAGGGRVCDASHQDEPNRGALQRSETGGCIQSVIHWCFQSNDACETGRARRRRAWLRWKLVATGIFGRVDRARLSAPFLQATDFYKGFAHQSEHAECIQTLRRSNRSNRRRPLQKRHHLLGFRRGLTTEDATKNMVEGFEENRRLRGREESHALPRNAQFPCQHHDEGASGLFLRRFRPRGRDLQAGRLGAGELLFDIYHVQIMHGDLIAPHPPSTILTSPIITPRAILVATKSTIRRRSITPAS